MKRATFLKSIAAFLLIPFLPKPKAAAQKYPVGINTEPNFFIPPWHSSPSTWRYDPTKYGSVEILSGPGVEIKNGDKIIYDYGEDGTITVTNWELIDGKHPKNIKIIDLREATYEPYKKPPGLVMFVAP